MVNDIIYRGGILNENIYLCVNNLDKYKNYFESLGVKLLNPIDELNQPTTNRIRNVGLQILFPDTGVLRAFKVNEFVPTLFIHEYNYSCPPDQDESFFIQTVSLGIPHPTQPGVLGCLIDQELIEWGKNEKTQKEKNKKDLLKSLPPHILAIILNGKNPDSLGDEYEIYFGYGSATTSREAFAKYVSSLSSKEKIVILPGDPIKLTLDNMRIVTGKFDHEVFVSLMKIAEDTILYTGDQSFTEGFCLGKSGIYEMLQHKKRLVQAVDLYALEEQSNFSRFTPMGGSKECCPSSGMERVNTKLQEFDYFPKLVEKIRQVHDNLSKFPRENLQIIEFDKILTPGLFGKGTISLINLYKAQELQIDVNGQVTAEKLKLDFANIQFKQIFDTTGSYMWLRSDQSDLSENLS